MVRNFRIDSYRILTVISTDVPGGELGAGAVPGRHQTDGRAKDADERTQGSDVPRETLATNRALPLRRQ